MSLYRANEREVGRPVIGTGVALTAAAWLAMLAGTAFGQASSDDVVPVTPSADVGQDLVYKQAEDPTPEEVEGVQVSEYMTVDLFVQDEDLATVLQMLSMQSQRNIVASRDVVATVSANLYGVTFYEAMDAILHVNGYGYVEKGNFIYVYPAEVIAQLQAEQRKVVSKVIQLNYLNANDAAEFVAPLLSKGVGQIKTNGDAGDFQVTSKIPVGGEDFALSSTLVVYDYPENIEEIEALLDQLDTRPAQVLVESTILQTRLNEANAFGVDFALIGDLDFSDFGKLGGPLGVVNSLLQTDAKTGFTPADNRGNSLVSSPGNTAGPATLKLGIIHDDFSIFVRMLDEVSDTMVLSSPKILTLNRQPARVLVGRKLGYLSSTTTQTATTQTVQFLDTGTQLSFRPFIAKDGMIRLELAPSVSEGFIRESIDQGGNAVTIPDEITQEITTNVMVPDGSTVVLGGLFKETTTLSRRQVPVIGDIPILGAAFRGHDDSTDRSEIIFLIRPTIVNDEVLVRAGEETARYWERVRAGSRQGLLPFSRERQTAQLNVKAERYAKEGKLDKALWSLRRSLELDPTQEDAMEMRERLFNQREVWPSRSVLERMMDKDTAEDWNISRKWPKIKDGEIVEPHSQLDAQPEFEGTSFSAWGFGIASGFDESQEPQWYEATVDEAPFPDEAETVELVEVAESYETVETVESVDEDWWFAEPSEPAPATFDGGVETENIEQVGEVVEEPFDEADEEARVAQLLSLIGVLGSPMDAPDGMAEPDWVEVDPASEEDGSLAGVESDDE